MISLRKIRQQLPWIDILTKNIGGWGYIPFSNPPILANAAALGAGSNPFAAGCCTSCLSPWTAIGAAVYLAKDTRLNRIVAIKVLPSYLADSSELRERFEREARTIASLNHPHICALYDIGHQDGIDYLVMEYLEGETLAQRLVKGPLPLEQLLQYAIEIHLSSRHRSSTGQPG